jgi:hypothetical protein
MNAWGAFKMIFKICPNKAKLPRFFKRDGNMGLTIIWKKARQINSYRSLACCKKSSVGTDVTNRAALVRSSAASKVD